MIEPGNVLMQILRGLAAVVLSLAYASASHAADPKKGQQLFVKYGCYGCHGYNGQGANTGVKLAPDPKPADAIAAYIRNSQTAMMPPYSAAMVSDAEVADIHAWLASQPKPDPKNVPALLKE